MAAKIAIFWPGDYRAKPNEWAVSAPTLSQREEMGLGPETRWRDFEPPSHNSKLVMDRIARKDSSVFSPDRLV